MEVLDNGGSDNQGLTVPIFLTLNLYCFLHVYQVVITDSYIRQQQGGLQCIKN